MATIQVDHDDLCSVIRHVNPEGLDKGELNSFIRLCAAVHRGQKRVERYTFKVESPDRKIWAIKALRQLTDLPLRDAKDMVEAGTTLQLGVKLSEFMDLIREGQWGWAGGQVDIVILNNGRECKRIMP